MTDDSNDADSGWEQAVSEFESKDSAPDESAEDKKAPSTEAAPDDHDADDTEIAEDETTETAEDDQAEDEQPADIWADISDDQRKELDALRQRQRSAEGRVSALQRQIDKLKQPKQPKQPPKEKPAEEKAETSDKSDPQADAQAAAQEARDEFMEHMDFERPEWRKVADDQKFHEWVAEQPAYIQRKAYANDVDGVLTVLDRWDDAKKQTERSAKAGAIKTKRAERLAQSRETGGRKSPAPKTDTAAADDPDSGWELAVSEYEQRQRHGVR